MNARLRFAVLMRDNFTCRYCGRKAPDVTLHVDHVQARSRGGVDDPTNLVTACAECNIGKMTSTVSIEAPPSVPYRRQPRIRTIELSAWTDPYRGDRRFTNLMACSFYCSMGPCERRMVDFVEGPEGRMYCSQHAYEALVREGLITIHPDPAGADDTLEEAVPPVSNAAWTSTGKALRRASAATS